VSEPDLLREKSGGVKTYRHITPDEDNPEDHSEGDCPCDPLLYEREAVVAHRPLGDAPDERLRIWLSKAEWKDLCATWSARKP
jgi:hypothetical protein